MELFGKILDRVNRFVEYFVSFLLVLMVVVVFLQVIFRFVIKSSLPWSEEMARYILVWISFLGASIGVKRQAHIGVEAVTNLLPFKTKNVVAAAANAFASIFFIIMIIWGYKLVGIVSRQVSPAMEISMGIPYSAIFFSGILMFAYSIYNFSVIAKRMREGTR